MGAAALTLPLFTAADLAAGTAKVRQAARDRVAEQRAVVARDYAAEWLWLVEHRKDAVDAIVAVARGLATSTTGYLSIAKVWEDARRSVVGGLDQNHRAPAARWLMDHVPELAGRFRTRNSPGDPERAR